MFAVCISLTGWTYGAAQNSPCISISVLLWTGFRYLNVLCVAWRFLQMWWLSSQGLPYQEGESPQGHPGHMHHLIPVAEHCLFMFHSKPLLWEEEVLKNQVTITGSLTTRQPQNLTPCGHKGWWPWRPSYRSSWQLQYFHHYWRLRPHSQPCHLLSIPGLSVEGMASLSGSSWVVGEGGAA